MAYRRWARTGSVSVAIALWLCLGLAVPVVLSLYSGDVATDTVEAAPGDAFSLSEAVELSASPGIRVERGTVAFIDANGNSIPSTSLHGGTSPAAGIRLFNGLISLGAPRAGTRRSLAPIPSAGASPFPVSPYAEALLAGRYDTLSLRRTMVQLNGLFEAPETLTDVKADVSLRRRGYLTIKGTGRLRGQLVTLDAMLSLGQAERKDGVLQRAPLKLSLKGDLIDASFEGRLMATPEDIELQGQAEMALPSGRGLARWFGAYWPSGTGLRDLSVKGQMRFSREEMTFENAVARMDGNEATGVLGLRLRQPRPVLTGTLAYKSFDAKPYMTAATDDGAGAPAAAPLSWSSLAGGALTVPLGLHLDADLRVSAERVQLGSLELGRIAVTIALKDGRLLADVADLRFNGGGGGGQITADFTGYMPRMNLRGKLEEVDLGRLSSILAGSPMLQGRADVVVDLAGSGATPHDVLRALAGRIVVRAQTPGRLGLDLRALAGAARNQSLTGWGAAARGTTSFEGLELRLVLRDGTILTETAEARSGDTVWSATGVVNLLSDRIDVRLGQAAPGQAGAPPALGAQTVIELHGPMREPQVRVSPGP